MKSNRKPFGRAMITPPESCEVRSRLFGPMYLPGSRKSSALLTKSPSVACALNRESEYEIGVFNLEAYRAPDVRPQDTKRSSARTELRCRNAKGIRGTSFAGVFRTAAYAYAMLAASARRPTPNLKMGCDSFQARPAWPTSSDVVPAARPAWIVLCVPGLRPFAPRRNRTPFRFRRTQSGVSAGPDRSRAWPPPAALHTPCSSECSRGFG